MAELTLDTSGAVPMGAGENMGLEGINLRWSDLDAFTQGYVEALLRAANEVVWPGSRTSGALDVRFSDLAPETLAAILKDCADVADFAEFFADDPGASFWLNRQSEWPAWRDRRPRLIGRFPPLTVTLGDDGKVYLRAAQ